MTSSMIKKRLDGLIGCVTFEYKGHPCGVDPLAHDDFNMWYGNLAFKARSIDEVMTTKLFDGKSLTDIANDITDLEY